MTGPDKNSCCKTRDGSNSDNSPPTLPTVVLTFEFFELGVESPVSEVGIGDTLLGVGVEDPTLVVEVGTLVNSSLVALDSSRSARKRATRFIPQKNYA